MNYFNYPILKDNGNSLCYVEAMIDNINNIIKYRSAALHLLCSWFYFDYLKTALLSFTEDIVALTLLWNKTGKIFL
jgi:hypothetical protein